MCIIYKYTRCERLINFILGLSFFLFFSPIIVGLSILSIIFLRSPVFFVQERIGYNEKPFKLIKFRTMKNIKDSNGNLLSDDKRLTKYGSFLREYSLDELPTLVNVLKGDMHFVGPRPLIPEYLLFYTTEQKTRHAVKPGITGWAQCNGRNAISWEQKLSMDVWYVKNKTLFLDFKILCITFIKVLKKEGVAHEGHATMPRFDEKN